MMKRFLISVLLLAACEGPMGPPGPEGPQGPQGIQGLPGPAGEGTRLTLVVPSEAIASNIARASTLLPEAVGSDPTDPPLVACYSSSDPDSGVWRAVNVNSNNVVLCTLRLTDGRWTVTLDMMQVGDTAAFVILY